MSIVCDPSLPYAQSAVEEKWQSFWKKHDSFQVDNASSRPPFYVLEMFPYPSGALHMGHARNYSIGDVLARYRWAKGYEVLHPMGWDAFGLPAENAALKHGIHPKVWTYENARIMKGQCQRMGFSHQWSREIFSCAPDYFAHEQKIFLDFYKAGLAYQKESYVNWDPVEHSVLANEQVIEGRGWRSGALVEKRLLKQWFLRISDFAQELLDDLDTLDQWPESVKHMQRNWIGRSTGMLIRFPIVATNKANLNKDEAAGSQAELGKPKTLEVYTTKPETLFGVTFCALAWDHPLMHQAVKDNADLEAFVAKLRQGSTCAADIETQEKMGMDTGIRVTNPMAPFAPPIAVYVVNYVKSDYGSGAVMGVPGHDERDAEFAARYALPFTCVVDAAGYMMNSRILDGLSQEQARATMCDLLEAKEVGQKKVMYRLRDWGIGRQRYWGAPIPMIVCPQCDMVPVPEKDLPVVLPEDVEFTGSGNPLERHPTWRHIACPQCGGAAQRECDTFDTFFESSWYFARFCDAHNRDQAFSRDLVEKWLPVSQYVGGIEHAILHLLYARFFTKALKKCAYWDINEPFKGLFTQGMVCHKTFKDPKGEWVYPQDVCPETQCHVKTGEAITVGRSEKMSKSKCNVVDVNAMVDAYGADAVRLFLLSDTPSQKDLEWSEEGIQGAWRYVRRLWVMGTKIIECLSGTDFTGEPCSWPVSATECENEADQSLGRATVDAITGVEKSIEDYALNKAIAHIRQLSNILESYVASGVVSVPLLAYAFGVFLRLMAPFMPHLAEELASGLGWRPGIHTQPWPALVNVDMGARMVVVAVQVNGKTRATLSFPAGTAEEEVKARALEDEKVQKYLSQGQLKRCVWVPDRMLSLVVS